MSDWGMQRVAIGVPDIIMLVFTVTLMDGSVPVAYSRSAYRCRGYLERVLN
jgi:hypothetical protein